MRRIAGSNAAVRRRAPPAPRRRAPFKRRLPRGTVRRQRAFAPRVRRLRRPASAPPSYPGSAAPPRPPWMGRALAGAPLAQPASPPAAHAPCSCPASRRQFARSGLARSAQRPLKLRAPQKCFLRKPSLRRSPRPPLAARLRPGFLAAAARQARRFAFRRIYARKKGRTARSHPPEGIQLSLLLRL